MSIRTTSSHAHPPFQLEFMWWIEKQLHISTKELIIIINKIKLINRCDDKYKSANSKKGKKIKNNKEIIKKLYIKNNY